MDRDPTLPASVRGRVNNKKKLAEQKLRERVERVAEGEKLTTGLAQIKQRDVIISGSGRSTPNYHILATAFRYVPQGRATFIGCILRAARNGDSDALAWMTVFESLHETEQNSVDLDNVCASCGVAPDKMMAIAVSTQMKLGNDIAEFVAAVFHPKIVRQTAKSAVRIGGEHAAIAQRDRELMLQHGRFIAAPKGINVNVSADARAQAAAAAAAAQEAPGVPIFSESVLGAQRAHISVQRAIEAGDQS